MAIFDTLAVAWKVAIFENFVAEKHENVLATLETGWLEIWNTAFRKVQSESPTGKLEIY